MCQDENICEEYKANTKDDNLNIHFHTHLLSVIIEGILEVSLEFYII